MMAGGIIDYKDEQFQAKCRVDETKAKKYGSQPHSCISDNECTGMRYCTSFGWCRGKTLCSPDKLKKACEVNEDVKSTMNELKYGKKGCISDNDCKGQRLCDTGKCSGEDQLCL